MKNNKIKVVAVGDIAPGDSLGSGLGILSISRKYGCDYLFNNIITTFKDCDLLIGNLEGTLSQLTRTKDLRLCGLPEMASSLKKAGFDVLSIANNHVLDHGPEVFKETITHCHDAGLMICGLRGESKYYSQPVILEKKGSKIGILAYNWVGSGDVEYAGNYIAQIYDGIVNYSWTRDRERDVEAINAVKSKNKKVIHDIKELRKHVDIIILMSHWGYEWTIYPPYGVTLEAKSFLDAGADVIIGSHTHVPQGVEKYNNKLVVYSLGDFLFDSFTRENRSGMLIKCNLSPGVSPEYEIFFIKRDNSFRPELVTTKDSIDCMKLIQKSSEAITKSDASRILEDNYIYKEYERGYNILKIKKIIFLLRLAICKPSTICEVGKKIIGLLKVILLRIQGKKVRW